MKKGEKEIRVHKLIFRISKTELSRIKALQAKTTERNISDYLRKVSLQQPLVVRYRNATADDFLRDMVALKRELSSIGNNYNQAVKKLHVLDKIPEFRSWLIIYDSGRAALLQKIETINERILQLYEQWLQK